MAEIFNWATERVSKETRTKEVFESVWTAIVGSTDGFEEFFEQCQKNPESVNGVTFQKKIKEHILAQNSERWQEVINEQAKIDNDPDIPAIKKKDKKDDVEKKFFSEIAKEKLDAFKEIPRTTNAMQDDFVHVMTESYLAQITCDGFLPYDTVVTAGFEVGKGNSLQMGCGEGKTNVLVFAAMCKILGEPNGEKEQVFLTSSTEILADETYKDTFKKYLSVGIKDVVKISLKEIVYPNREAISLVGKTDAEKQDLLREAYSCSIVIADNETIIQHKMSGFIPEKSEAFSARTLLADEADYVLLDQYRPVQKLGEKYSDEEAKKRNNLRMIARAIILKLMESGKSFYNKDDSNMYVDFNQEGRQNVVKIINNLAQKDPTLDKQTLAEFVYEALVVETVYKENRDYQIIPDGNGGKMVVSEDRASGAEIMDLPQGIAQALDVKLGFDIHSEYRVLDAMNVTSVYNELFDDGHKSYISGTLGTNTRSISQQIEMSEIGLGDTTTYECSPQKKSIRIQEPKRLFRTREDRRQYAVENAEAMVDSGRPVLIGCVSDEEVNATIEELRKKQESRAGAQKEPLKIIKYTAASQKEFLRDKKDPKKFEEKYGVSLDFVFDEKKGKRIRDIDKFSDFIKHITGKTNYVIVGTSIIGRGTTIKTSKDINEKGGIHVIINGLHETSSRNQIQYAARTARGSDKGSFDEFMSLDELPEDMRARYDDLQIPQSGLNSISSNAVEEIYGEFFERVDERQSNVRGHVNNLMLALSQAKENIMILFGDDLTSAKKAIALLTERAFLIQNRACGNSEETKAREYIEELNAFADLYISKILSENNNEPFNERDFLATVDNGKYKKFADTYLEFTESEISEIYHKFGISEEALGKIAKKAKVRNLQQVVEILKQNQAKELVEEAAVQTQRGE